jgi:hypothetical protein
LRAFAERAIPISASLERNRAFKSASLEAVSWISDGVPQVGQASDPAFALQRMPDRSSAGADPTQAYGS